MKDNNQANGPREVGRIAEGNVKEVKCIAFPLPFVEQLLKALKLGSTPEGMNNDDMRQILNGLEGGGVAVELKVNEKGEVVQ